MNKLGKSSYRVATGAKRWTEEERCPNDMISLLYNIVHNYRYFIIFNVQKQISDVYNLLKYFIEAPEVQPMDENNDLPNIPAYTNTSNTKRLRKSSNTSHCEN